MGTEWNLKFRASELKEKQSQLQGSLTEIFDAFIGLKEEAVHLSAMWKGEAAEAFRSAFRKELAENYQCAEEMGKLAGMFSGTEAAFENCEAKIRGILN